MLNVIREICKKYEGYNYFVGNIPEKNVRTVYFNLKIPRNEEIIAFANTALIGVGKCGMAICSSGLYWKNDSTTDTIKEYLPWRELADVDIVNIEKYEISLGDGNYIGIAGLSMKRNQFVALLNELQQMVIDNPAYFSAPSKPAAPIVQQSAEEKGHACCYYHPERNPVGTCSECGKNLCKECFDQYEGICKDCASDIVEQYAEEKRDIARGDITAYVGGMIFGFLQSVAIFIISVKSNDPIPPQMIPIIFIVCIHLWGSVAITWRWAVRFMREHFGPPPDRELVIWFLIKLLIKVWFSACFGFFISPILLIKAIRNKKRG